MIDVRDKIRDFVKRRGSVLTMDVVRELKVSSIIAGAVLSELVSKGLLSVSHLKVGSSPVYYVPSQKSQLEKYSSYLKNIEKQAFELLKQRRILKDSELPPALRVALSNIKDFAVLIDVVTPQGVTERYWKFYNVSNEEVKQLLTQKASSNVNKVREQSSANEKKTVEEKPQPEHKPEQKSQILISPEGQVKLTEKDNASTKKDSPEKAEITEKSEPIEEIKTQKGFISKVIEFFNQNNVGILSSNILKKDKEAEFIISYASPLGNIKLYTYCADKKRISDKDISFAYLESLNKRLPLLFITSGELTKKCKELLNTKFKGTIVKKIN